MKILTHKSGYVAFLVLIVALFAIGIIFSANLSTTDRLSAITIVATIAVPVIIFFITVHGNNMRHEEYEKRMKVAVEFKFNSSLSRLIRDSMGKINYSNGPSISNQIRTICDGLEELISESEDPSHLRLYYIHNKQKMLYNSTYEVIKNRCNTTKSQATTDSIKRQLDQFHTNLQAL